MPILNVPIPEGRLGIKLQDGPEQGNVIRIEFVLDDSVMKGKRFVPDGLFAAGAFLCFLKA